LRPKTFRRFATAQLRYAAGVQTMAEQLAHAATFNRVVVPDLWQQEAVSALRVGQDVVVHAPTGAGKTLIFELWSNQGKNRGQAIYTVPTRALANDKLAEWRARGWNAGIATGDLAENLGAPVIVATLETQKHRLIQGDGPTLLVVDEYQMIADPDRGLNYELAIALAPARTQLLLLSGSVENPQQVVKWLRRLGRDAVLVRSDERPVPLEEVYLASLSYHVPSEIRGYWPRMIAKALAENLGPVLLFAPRRQMAEALALELSRQLPTPDPLALSAAQKQLAGEHLARLLKTRVAYHHSGLSYGARAGVVEPLAKAGQLRVVVATMGLAAGINFSLRSVALAADSYRRDAVELPLRPDELLQMFGRAGRRGIDETGYVLVSANDLRLRDAHAAHLARNGMVDWGALLSVMHGAARQGRAPFPEAVRAQERLFTVKPIFLGVEEAMRHPTTPCGLQTDAERARHVRRRLREFRNSRGEWERWPALRDVPLRDVRIAAPKSEEVDEAAGGNGSPAGPDGEAVKSPMALMLRPALSEPAALEKIGTGTLVVLSEEDGRRLYGRTLTVAERLHDGRVVLVKWVRRLTNWHGRQTGLEAWQQKIAPLVEKRFAAQRTPLVRFVESPQKITALVSLAEWTIKVPVDRHGVALWRPVEREVLPDDCARCELTGVCRQLSPAAGTALLWRRLGLVDAKGAPTRRGRLVSFFSGGDGLAISAALEDETYPLDELIYDLANLDAGFRFCGEDNRWAGRLAIVSQRAYGVQSLPGYLENGVPPRYGAGAEAVVAGIHRDPLSKFAWIGEWLDVGDIDRVIIEWRSRLRQVAHAPELAWPRWQAFQQMAKAILNETESPTLTEFPPLEYHQTRRVEHHLVLRRH
jgi:superfamily II DNA/RNA helicase